MREQRGLRASSRELRFHLQGGALARRSPAHAGRKVAMHSLAATRLSFNFEAQGRRGMRWKEWRPTTWPATSSLNFAW